MRETVMEVIERKDSSQRENNVTRHFSPRAQRAWANLLVLAGGSGRKQVTRVCQGSFVNPWATKEENLKSERVRYLAARIMWTATTSPDKVFSRAGRESWTFCTVHVNNALARKRNACKEVLIRFWKEVISHRIDGIGGLRPGSGRARADTSVPAQGGRQHSALRGGGRPLVDRHLG